MEAAAAATARVSARHMSLEIRHSEERVGEGRDGDGKLFGRGACDKQPPAAGLLVRLARFLPLLFSFAFLGCNLKTVVKKLVRFSHCVLKKT